MQTLDKTTAGPSLNALAAAAIGRVLLQLDVGPDPHDYGLSGSWTTEVEGLTLTRSNVISVEPPEIYSRVTWEISHPAWLLIFTERRQLTGGKFARSAPYQVVVSGDLLEAARFLHVPANCSCTRFAPTDGLARTSRSSSCAGSTSRRLI